VECGSSTAVFALVLNVIVYQKRIVKHLESHCRAKGVVGIAPKGGTGCEAQSGAKSFAATQRIVNNQIVEIGSRLPIRNVAEESLKGERLIAFEEAADQKRTLRSANGGGLCWELDHATPRTSTISAA
jgi:hypothetical protein